MGTTRNYCLGIIVVSKLLRLGMEALQHKNPHNHEGQQNMSTTTNQIVFQAWPKIARLKRTIYVTEKIDGTNAAIGITEDGVVYAQSRTRIITPEQDNHGFAAWVYDNADELRTTLGTGLHFGEWWGQKIQRTYGLTEKRFSLFNSSRWIADVDDNYRCLEAPLCFVVPIIGTYESFDFVDDCIDFLRYGGSVAAPGFKDPEGVVVYHAASRSSFKVTLEKDDEYKGKQS